MECVCIWIQYSTLSRACGAVALQIINVGPIHVFLFDFYLGTEDNDGNQYVLKMVHVPYALMSFKLSTNSPKLLPVAATVNKVL